MYLVKFSTNSNQEFINQPFESSDNNKKQKEIIMQSKKIEDFTYHVLRCFNNSIPEKFNFKKIKKLMTRDFENGMKIIEFTSGKMLFILQKNDIYNEEYIINKFDEILKDQIAKASKTGESQLISFNYDYVEIQNEPKSYVEIQNEFENKSDVYNLLENNFDTLFTRNDKEFELKDEQNQENTINLEELLTVENLNELDGNNNRNSYTKLNNNEGYLYNKMFVFKLDLNNIGSNFAKIKTQDLDKYSEISRNFFQLIRVDKINIDLKGKKIDKDCVCMFAAGDDIIFLSKLNQINKIIDYLEDIIKEINCLFKDVKEAEEITIAGGLQIADYRLPIRLYYEKVECELSEAKKDKGFNILSFENNNYKFDKFKELINIGNKIVNLERSKLKSKDTEAPTVIESSTFFYNLIERLNYEKYTDYRLLILILLENEHIEIADKTKSLLIEQLNKLDKKEFIAMLKLMLALSYLPNEIEEIKSEIKVEINPIDTYLNILDEKNIPYQYLKKLGNSEAMQYELLEQEKKYNGDIINEKEAYKGAIIDMIFRKDNALYMRMQKSDIIDIENEFISKNKVERMNFINSNILAIKYGKVKIEEKIEEGGY